MHARHLGSEISDCGVRVGPGSRETIPNQGVALVHGQGSLAHECNEGVALVHGQGARVACPRRHTAGKGHFSQHRPYIFRPSFTPSVFAREAHFPEHGHRSGRHILFLGEARAQEDNSDNSHLLSTHQVAQGNCRAHPCIAGRSQGLTPQILALNSQTDGWRRPQGRLQGGNSLYYAQLSCPNCKYKLRVASC